VSNYSTRAIRPERLLCDAERDLLVIAKILVSPTFSVARVIIPALSAKIFSVSAPSVWNRNSLSPIDVMIISTRRI